MTATAKRSLTQRLTSFVKSVFAHKTLGQEHLQALRNAASVHDIERVQSQMGRRQHGSNRR